MILLSIFDGEKLKTKQSCFGEQNSEKAFCSGRADGRDPERAFSRSRSSRRLLAVSTPPDLHCDSLPGLRASDASSTPQPPGRVPTGPSGCPSCFPAEFSIPRPDVMTLPASLHPVPVPRVPRFSLSAPASRAASAACRRAGPLQNPPSPDPRFSWSSCKLELQRQGTQSPVCIVGGALPPRPYPMCLYVVSRPPPRSPWEGEGPVFGLHST